VADAGLVVVSLPALPAALDASVDQVSDAETTDARARSTLGAVCVDDPFVDLQLAELSADGAALSTCFADGSRAECFALELATGVYRETPRFRWRKTTRGRQPARPPLPRYVARQTKAGKAGDFAFSPDGSRLFVTRALERSAPGPAPMWWAGYDGEVYDTRQGRLLASVPIVGDGWKTALTAVAWLDDAHVYVRDTVMEFEYTSTGHVIDTSQGKAQSTGACTQEDDLVHVADDVWVFDTDEGLVWQHVHGGSTLRKLDVSALGIVTPQMIAGRHGEILVVDRAVHTFATRGDVLVIDAAAGTVLHKYLLDKCPAPAQ
jgi:hypothetical protein